MTPPGDADTAPLAELELGVAREPGCGIAWGRLGLAYYVEGACSRPRATGIPRTPAVEVLEGRQAVRLEPVTPRVAAWAYAQAERTRSTVWQAGRDGLVALDPRWASLLRPGAPRS